MLSLLLDEHISQTIARQIATRRPEITIVSLHDWEAGRYLETPDDDILRAAAPARLTLVTYDQRTIPSLLVRLASEGFPHGGIVFIDERVIPPDAFGPLIRSLIWLWEQYHDWDWENRIFYLRPPP
jgi:hypothetical protein